MEKTLKYIIDNNRQETLELLESFGIATSLINNNAELYNILYSTCHRFKNDKEFYNKIVSIHPDYELITNGVFLNATGATGDPNYESKLKNINLKLNIILITSLTILILQFKKLCNT